MFSQVGACFSQISISLDLSALVTLVKRVDLEHFWYFQHLNLQAFVKMSKY